MKIKYLLLLALSTLSLSAFAQDGGVRGTVISRVGRQALADVKVTLGDTGLTTTTDKDGNFVFENVPQGDYDMQFSTPEYEDLDIRVKVADTVRDMQQVVVSPSITDWDYADMIFPEEDMDSGYSDEPSMPAQLYTSKDVYNNVASYRFSEMRFNIRGYDSQYQDISLNGIKFNDAMTGYGPWSLWSGLNDATRNQNNTPGLIMNDWGLGGVAGMTNINATASQMRKGFRVSVSGSNQLYGLRAMVSYASGQLDNGWSYAFSAGTRQLGNGYVDGVYYNGFSYFASVEKLFGGNRHKLGFTILASPTERGAQQASTQEAYDLLGSNYYNPNVGMWNGKLRNSRVRVTHEPIAMLTYTFNISDQTRLTAATALRFGKNAYSALTWNRGTDPRPDYYRYLGSYSTNPLLDPDMTGDGLGTSPDGWLNGMIQQDYNNRIFQQSNGYIDFDGLYNENRNSVDPTTQQWAGDGQHRSQTAIENRFTNQIDYHFTANISHDFNVNSHIIGGVNFRLNRTSYFDEIKDLMGGDYWYDIDKFADRDQAYDPTQAQNDLEYYNATGHARIVREGDKFNYNYRAHVMNGSAWLSYAYSTGGFAMKLGGEAGGSSMYREGMWQKGLFPDNSKGDSKKLDYFTYNVKGNFSYRFSRAHELEADVDYSQNAPEFATAFLSPRTRNSVVPGLKTEKVFGVDLTYNVNYPWLKARLSGYYTNMTDGAKTISFYDDTNHSFTNFAMSGIDKRYYGVELGISIPLYQGLSLVGAANWGDYTYTSNPLFTETVDNIQKVVATDKVNWKGMYIESTPQIAANIGLDFHSDNNWFVGVNLNYYDKLYLSMNPMYRTSIATEPFDNVMEANAKILGSGVTGQAFNTAYAKYMTAKTNKDNMRAQDDLGHAFTLSANVGKNWYVGNYMIGFSVEVKNILNNQDIKTGGYEQMRMSRIRTGVDDQEYYKRFAPKYFYMLGTNFYANIYFRF